MRTFLVVLAVVVVLVVSLAAWALLVTGGELPFGRAQEGRAQDAIDICALAFSHKPDLRPSKPAITKAEAATEERVFFECMRGKGYDYRPDQCQKRDPNNVMEQGPSLWSFRCYHSR